MSVKPKMHALWLFDVVDDKETALMYFKTAIEKFPEHGMVPLTIGRFRAAQKGDLGPGSTMFSGNGSPKRHSRSSRTMRPWPRLMRKGRTQ